MSTQTKTKVTRKQAEKVLAALVKSFPGYTQGFTDDTYTTMTPLPADSPDMPQIFQNWDGYDFVIIWESGSPYDWPQYFPDGGIEEEFGIKVPEATLPKGVWTEAVNGCVLAILPA